jgi:hypothetical protein
MTNEKKINTTAVAGLAGAVIGAGMTAAAVALSDEKKRKTVAHKLVDVKNHAMDMMTKTQEVAEDKIEEAERTVAAEKQMLNDIKEPTVKTDEKIMKSL